MFETTITLPTYPFADFLVEQLDPVYNIPVLAFNRAEYEAAAPAPAPADYTGVVLENPYLRLTFLPELGGRLYSAVVKSTGQEIFYHNPVVKPSRYGGLQPPESNWWLAAGGMEWAYPIQEHGYRWGVPWTYIVEQTAGRATIILSDTGPDRVGAEVRVTLPAGSASFLVEPKLINNTANEVPVQFWLNAALTLGSNTMSPHTRFILPMNEAIVHSRGENGWDIPGAQAAMAWPQGDEEVNLSAYNQWSDYLGLFVPYLDRPFVGAYNPETNLGVARLVEPGTVPGTKLFAFGQDFAFRDYTDDNSQYFEIWGGINTGFWPENDVPIPAGATVQWQESWWPLPGLGGLTWATPDAAIHLTQAGQTYQLSLLAPRSTQGRLVVQTGPEVVVEEAISALPNTPLNWQFSAAGEPVQIRLLDANHNALLDYCLGCE